MEICVIEPVKNLGISKCVKITQLPKSIITTEPGFKFLPAETADATAFQAALQLAVLQKKAYIFPLFSQVENASEETVYNTTALGVKRVRKGFYAWRFTISEGLCTHIALQSHFSNRGRAFIWDVEDGITGTLDAAGNFYGLTFSLLSPEKLLISDGSVPTGSPVYLVCPNPNELDKSGGIADGGFINFVTPVSDVKLTVLTPAPSATTINVSVKNACDSEPIVALAAADFLLKTAAGVAQAIVSRVDHGDGSYTLTGVGWVTGTLTLVSPEDLSLVGYESAGPVAITIP